MPNPGLEDDIESEANPNSKVDKTWFCRAKLANAEAEKGYQSEREGYFCADRKDSCPEHLRV